MTCAFVKLFVQEQKDFFSIVAIPPGLICDMVKREETAKLEDYCADLVHKLHFKSC